MDRIIFDTDSAVFNDDAAALADLESQEELLASFVGMFETMLAYMPRMVDDMLGETAGLVEALEAKKDG